MLCVGMVLLPATIANGLIQTAASHPSTQASHPSTQAPHPSTYKQSTDQSLLLDDAFIRDARQAIELLYNRETDASLAAMQHWRVRHADHPVWPLWEALDAWWPLLVNPEDTSHDERFVSRAEHVVDLCDRALSADPGNLDALIVRSIMNGQLARYYSNRYRWYASFRHARRAMRDFFEVEERHPDIPDLDFGMGLYRYFAAYLVEEYPLARPVGWMLPRGNRAEGLERLAMAADSSIFVQPEAVYFLGHVYLHYERQPSVALEYLQQLYERYPDNSYYHRLYVRSLHHLNRNVQSLRAIDQSLHHWRSHNNEETRALREELYATRGQIHFAMGDFDQAKRDFYQALYNAEQLKPFASRHYLLVSLYYLGRLSVSEGELALGRAYFNRVASVDSENPYVERAQEALRELNRR